MPDTTAPARENLGRYMTVELRPRPPGRKTDSWRICNRSSGMFLASVEWLNAWRQYVLTEVMDDTVFSASCLDDISRFLKRVNAEQKGRKG